jgi:hypothetical protein
VAAISPAAAATAGAGFVTQVEQQDVAGEQCAAEGLWLLAAASAAAGASEPAAQRRSAKQARGPLRRRASRDVASKQAAQRKSAKRARGPLGRWASRGSGADGQQQRDQQQQQQKHNESPWACWSGGVNVIYTFKCWVSKVMTQALVMCAVVYCRRAC